MLFEPLRSAEPPINCGNNIETFSMTLDEHCLVAKLGFDSKYLVFSFLIKVSRSFTLEFIYKSFNSD